MSVNQTALSYKTEMAQLRLRLSQLQVCTIQQKALGEVRQWRQKFDTSASQQLERVLNELEKQKEVEVDRLTNELKASLNEFRETQCHILDEIEAFTTKIEPDDDIQWDFVRFRLDSVNKRLNSLHMDIVVKQEDGSMRRRSSTALARNKLTLTKVFTFETPRSSVASSTSRLKPIQNFLNKASSLGASYYQINVRQR